MVHDTEDWEAKVASAPVAELAAQLRKDQMLCRQRRLPSGLAYHMPPVSTDKGNDVAAALGPHRDFGIPTAVIHLQYSSIIESIKGYLSNVTPEVAEFGMSSMPGMTNPVTNPAMMDDDGLRKSTNDNSCATLEELGVKRQEAKTACLVVDNLLNRGHLEHDDVVSRLKNLLSNVLGDLTSMNASSAYVEGKERLVKPSEDDERLRQSGFGGEQRRKCYICLYQISRSHHLYPALCLPCGSFNLSQASLSLPSRLNLSGTTVLVTGGRINLGFQTALRFLRCGAKVIVTSRYPYDAEERFLAENDSEHFLPRLQILGADFRSAKDVFHLVREVKVALERWTQGSDPKLDVLVNNAAQTLTDPIRAEQVAVKNEKSLAVLTEGRSTLISTNYEARVRAGGQTPWMLERVNMDDEGRQIHSYTSQKTEPTEPTELSTQSIETGSEVVVRPSKSSWVQTLDEIPYEDLITAHSVNSFVPLILIRELVPYMSNQRSDAFDTNDRANDASGSQRSSERETHVDSRRTLRYIINVSSREGLFESHPLSRAKAGHHVHTNMSKAALNMITQTEAATFWQKHKIAMNSVDPGYMSAAPEIRTRTDSKPNDTPLTFDDGAARVLWPIAMGEKGEAVWGRFLKHFGGIQDVNLGIGR